MKYTINVAGGIVTDAEVPTIREGDIIRFVSPHYDYLVAVVDSVASTCEDCPFTYRRGERCPIYKERRLCPIGLIFVRVSDTLEEL
jgi:hypothetical protein